VRTLLRDRADSLPVQLFRYAIVGGLAFAVDFGSLWAFTEILGLHYLVSAALAFLLGLTTNYLLSLAWVFSHRTLANRYAEFLVFAVIGVVGLGLNEVLMWLLTDGAGVHYLGSKAVSTAVVFLWNFLARRFALFHGGREAA
jgi:putative flippase GtrA